MRVRVDQVIERQPQVSRRDIAVPNVRPQGGVSESNFEFNTLVVNSELESLSASDGALVVRGGAGIMGDLNVADEVSIGTDLTVSGFTECQGQLQVNQQTDLISVTNVNGVLSALSGATSIDTTTGALVVDGGVGVSGDLNLGGDANVGGDLAHAGTNAGFFGTTPAAQPAPIADATGAGDVVAQLNALLAALRTLGIIDT